MLWNSLLIVFLIESTAVRIPTRDIIPIAIIRTVRIVLRRFDLIEFREILILSTNSPLKRIIQI